ncbi:hypothetical protein RUM43_005429 [Polyplax serrata]|uniref:Geminin n=1 Tax=Polyplax serrata TaxID=468196 RepID=A0AAN8P001_POLSC
MEKKESKRCKKTLNILRIAATDKENLTSKVTHKKTDAIKNKGIKLQTGKRFKKNINTNETEMQVKDKISKTKPDNSTKSDTVLPSDLIIDNPSENYWQNLAESQAKALNSALKENVDLHNKLNELEYENSRLKAMLDEAKSLVEVLTEMIEQNDDEANGNNKEDSTFNETKEFSSDSDPEEMSFQSSI